MLRYLQLKAKFWSPKAKMLTNFDCNKPKIENFELKHQNFDQF